MKTILHIKLILLLFFISFQCFSQTQESTLFFKDGDSIPGFGMIQNNKVKFKIAIDSKAEFWDFESIVKIDFHGFKMTKTYEYVKLNAYSEPILIELVVKGEVSLYRKENSKWIGDNINNPGSGRKIIEEINYLKRDKEEFPTCINCEILNSWAKNTSNFLSDCEYLVKKIKTNKFSSLQMKEIVETYNDFCTEL
ncbi:hypothetical protein [Flavobacterium sp.]|uniref:hypothetical protein n=1 Tax=Flavobacterium sp. TaxID=239 RepID=UPI002B4B879D|nr:hypothetical protein [Flavobacterium sp.]HLF50951.1 hypothetical protein [Flavobacterium sp.]